jgi:hypothetical protein
MLSVILVSFLVIPALFPVIPAQAGIHITAD